MLNKIKTLIIIILAITLAAASTAGAMIHLYNSTETPNIRIAHDNLYSDNGYVNYAEEVYLDVEKYPDTAEMGLFWSYWDDSKNDMTLVPADSAEGASLVDPAKPTIILVHGMLSNGNYWQDVFHLNKNVAMPEQFGLESEGVPMGLIWQNKGWNVGFFHYNRFAAEGFDPTAIEAKIWATDHPYANMRYKHQDGTFENNVSEYSIAEHFAAEYIRAMNLLPDTMGTEEIRVAAHSMGGQVSTAALFLLTELADDGQLSNDKLPDRFALLDAYFSSNIKSSNGKFLSLSPTDITIRWSGKALPYNNTAYTMLDCIKALDARGIAIEYYIFDVSTLYYLLMPRELALELNNYCVIAQMVPQWDEINAKYNKTTDGHNGVRDWYLCSFYFSPVVDIEGSIAVSASTPTETIKTLKGKFYIMVTGSGTVIASDDTFELISNPR